MPINLTSWMFNLIDFHRGRLIYSPISSRPSIRLISSLLVSISFLFFFFSSLDVFQSIVPILLFDDPFNFGEREQICRGGGRKGEENVGEA